MKCQKVQMMISAYLDGEVTASKWQSVKQHIDGCPSCSSALEAFQQSHALFKHELAPRKPAAEIWPGIAQRLASEARPSWARRFVARLKLWLDGFVIRPPISVRLAQVGMAFAALLLSLVYVQQRPNASSREETIPVQVRAQSQMWPLPEHRQNGDKHQILQTAMATQVQQFLEQAGILLLEVENSDADLDTMQVSSLRQTSQDLLEKTIFVKENLKDSDLALLKKTIEQLEIVLFDIANIQDRPDSEEIDFLKAAILQNDLLIKIEIYDTDELERRMNEAASQQRESGTEPRRKI